MHERDFEYTWTENKDLVMLVYRLLGNNNKKWGKSTLF